MSIECGSSSRQFRDTDGWTLLAFVGSEVDFTTFTKMNLHKYQTGIRLHSWGKRLN